MGDSDFSAATDTESGVVVVLDANGETWGLDVCANRWAPCDRGRRSGRSAKMVYDPEADLVVAFDGPDVWTYSVEANTWKQMPTTTVAPVSRGSVHYVCDSASGDVLRLDYPLTKIWAYSPKSNTWAEVDQGKVRPTEDANNPDAQGFPSVMSQVTYDTLANRLVLILTGGLPYGQNQVWIFDRSAHTWKKQSAIPSEMELDGSNPTGRPPSTRRTAERSCTALGRWARTAGSTTNGKRSSAVRDGLPELRRSTPTCLPRHRLTSTVPLCASATPSCMTLSIGG